VGQGTLEGVPVSKLAGIPNALGWRLGCSNSAPSPQRESRQKRQGFDVAQPSGAAVLTVDEPDRPRGQVIDRFGRRSSTEPLRSGSGEMRSWRPHSGRTTHRRGNYRDRRLLCARRERPCRRAAEQRYELAPPHACFSQCGDCILPHRCRKGRIVHHSKFGAPTSPMGQKPALPRRSIAVRFTPNKQTPTGRVRCDAMCHYRTHAPQRRACRGRDASYLAPPAQIRT
jgi:hypothetical protein